MSIQEPIKEVIRYTYRFTLESKAIIEIPILLEAKTLDLIYTKPDSLSDWTLLECHQCPNCPLKKEQHPYCPIAVNISELMVFFSQVASYQEVEVNVKTQQRTYIVQTTVQEALSSILGIYMVTSGCPILDKLRPMARFHLPFSSYEETSYRALSMYLVIQYMRYKNGKSPDWDLEGFVSMYQNIQQVNRAFNKRLQKISDKDANSNALVILDCFASLIMMDAKIESLVPEQLKSIFEPFLDH